MANKKKTKNKDQHNTEKNILATSTITFAFVGIFLSAIAVSDDIENYVEPYKFSSIWITLGIIFGYITSKKLKPFINTIYKNLRAHAKSNVCVGIRLTTTIGFIGVFLFLGAKVNTSYSSFHKTYNSTLINKTERERGPRGGGYNKLHFIINGSPIELKCNKNFWDNHIIGDKIPLDFYISKMGFHYWKIKNEYN